mgnify:FL=1
MEDKDIPQQEWNNYLRKYKDKYRLYTERNINTKKTAMNYYRECMIKCKNGAINLHSLKNKLLAFFLYKGHPKLKNQLINNSLLTCIQEGNQEAIFTFNEENLSKFESILDIRKKRQLSPEALLKLKSVGFQKVIT